MTQNKADDICHIEDVFVHTVLGIEFPASCVMHEGQLQRCAKPIPKNAEPNLALIAEALRSPTPLHPKILDWIAGLFEKNREGGYKVERLVKRTSGPTYRGISESIEIAEFVENLIEDKKEEYQHNSKHPKWRGIRKEAIYAAQLHFGGKDNNGKPIKNKAASESKIEAALTEYKRASEEHARLNLEELKRVYPK